MASIKKNFLYSGLLTTANYIFPMLTYPYVSRVLGVTNIGTCNFIDSIIHYFIIFSMLGINIVGIREVAQNTDNRSKLNKIFSSLFWLNTITTSIALLFLIIATLYVNQLREHFNLMLIGALKLVFNYLTIDWFYKGLENFKYITTRSLIIRCLYVVSVFLFIHDADDYPIYYFLSVVCIVINAVVNLLYSRHFVTIIIQGVKLKKYIKTYMTMGFYLLLTSMYTTFNVAYLGFVAGGTEVGYYTTASKLYHIFIGVFTAFTGVMLPRMSSLLSEGKENKFKSLLNRSNDILLNCSIPVIIFVIIYAPTIIFVIAGTGYEGAIQPMQIMMPLMLIIGYEQIIIVQVLTPMKKDKAILLNSIMGSLTGLMLNILLVYYLKSIGSSIVWLFSELAVLCSAQHFVTKYARFSFPWHALFRYIIRYTPLAIVIMLCMLWIPNQWTSIIAASTISISYFLVLNVVILKEGEVRYLIMNCLKYVNSKSRWTKKGIIP